MYFPYNFYITLIFTFLQFYKDVSIDLMSSINSTFKFKSAEGLTRLDMRASFEKARKYSIVFTIACLIGALHWAIEPMIIKSNRIIFLY